MARHNPLVAIMLAIFLLFVSTLVNAGHPSFEPHPSEFKLNYVRIKPNDILEPWPDKRVPYCYENERARNVLSQFIRHGMSLWYGAGLPYDFVMEEVSRTECLANRKTTLEIRLYGDAVFHSSTGRTTPTGSDGPSMVLGVQNPEQYNGNLWAITHEIGHVWGLFHEQGDPAFWGTDGPFHFYCQHLAQFEEKSRGLSLMQIWGLDGICTNFWAAAQVEFTATNFLPLPEGFYTSPNNANSRDGDVDWKSIMLYPSNMFAINDGKTGLYSYIRRAGPAFIQSGEVPSPHDVYGIKTLYQARYESPPVTLYNDPQSSYHSLFTSMVEECRRRRR